MNIRRMNRLIKALKTEEAKNMFNMSAWALQPKGCNSPKVALKQGGECGTTCCIAGLAALIAPTFFDIVIEGVGDELCIRAKKSRALREEAFAEWLEIPAMDGYNITMPNSFVWDKYKRTDIRHAINVLESYREKGFLSSNRT